MDHWPSSEETCHSFTRHRARLSPHSYAIHEQVKKCAHKISAEGRAVGDVGRQQMIGEHEHVRHKLKDTVL